MDAAARLKSLPGWSPTPDGKAIRREYVLADFAAAAELVGRIVPLADEMDHHPDLHLTRYRRLEVVLTTHDAGRLTEKDFALAELIETLPKALRD